MRPRRKEKEIESQAFGRPQTTMWSLIVCVAVQCLDKFLYNFLFVLADPLLRGHEVVTFGQSAKDNKEKI